MTEIKIEIKSCADCPFVDIKRVYTSDNFERPDKWTCTKNNTVISGFVEWHDKIPVPDWCPARV